MGNCLNSKKSYRSMNSTLKHDPKTDQSYTYNRNLEMQSAMHVNESKLPPEIEDYIRDSNLHFQSEQEEPKVDHTSTKDFIGVTGIPKSIFDQITSQNLDNNHKVNRETLASVIYSLHSDLFESKFEQQLLTTKQFKDKLHSIVFIQSQPANYFQFLGEIGRGGMCKVFKVEHRLTKVLYAVRIIVIDSENMLDKFKEEIAVMQICLNEYIIAHHFSYLYERTLFMFIDYMEFGELTRFINHYYKAIPENIIAYITKSILLGLKSIHQRRQLHRDLKSENILISSKGDIKISDFGFALQLTKDKLSCQDIVGTPAWMAPQLIQKKQYNQSVDIWSLGVVVVQMCQGKPKYIAMKPVIAMYKIVTQEPEGVTNKSKELTAFVGRCLKKDPQLRASANQLLDDPFIVSVGDGKKERAVFQQMLLKMI